ncbi:MAG TPA: 4a-hydroxytetrahydrobiopterin dehydratase [Amycolatopsis sp.]|jgi:4a-hydroxytetrahydrobiopterin dehydratase|nr:4a-hydroxytetrahydrobiopterin dehydratase [Amycolatopsis sp.]
MAELLNDSEITTALSSVPDWNRSGDSITRSAELPSFAAAIVAVTRVGFYAEAADHHPDIDIRWRTVTFTLSTHALGGLTSRDFALARQIDAVLAAAV